jgi:Kef-type K+ transport system membrane component KefB
MPVRVVFGQRGETVMVQSRQCDVAVIGGGIAGLGFAIWLKKERPQTSIAVLEKAPSPPFKIGESLTSSTTQFLRDLGLPGATVALVSGLVLVSAAVTQAMGFEGIFGALVCGLAISSCGTLDRARLAPLRTVVMAVLAPVFFATAGLRMDLTALARPVVLLAGLIILAGAILGKFAGAYAGARLSHLGHWEALALGAGVNARGVVEVIIAMVGLRLGVLSNAMYTIIVLVAIATSLIAPPILRLTMSRVEYTAEEQLRTADYEAAGQSAGT